MTATISRPKISNWETSNIPNLTGKTALITGANSGLAVSYTHLTLPTTPRV